MLWEKKGFFDLKKTKNDLPRRSLNCLQIKWDPGQDTRTGSLSLSNSLRQSSKNSCLVVETKPEWSDRSGRFGFHQQDAW